MIIRHHLKKGHNDIPLKDIRYATEHVERNEEIRHIGFKVIGSYAGESERNASHRYEIIFETDKEYEDLLARALQMRDRFPEGKLPAIRGEQDEEVEDAEEADYD